MRFLYTLLFYLAVPLILARMAWRGRREPGYRQRWAERFGYYGKTQSRPAMIWFHAVSVGEAEAAFPLVRAIAKSFPNHPILVTATTPTGSARTRAVLGSEVAHVYLPYDLPDAVARFLAYFKPSLAVIMETEIWPNLFLACAAQNIPLAIVNARLSERSARGYARLGSFTQQTLARVSLIAAQTETDAQRFIGVGARKESVKVTGNLKYDLQLPTDYFQQADSLRHSLFENRKVWVAASTHEGEEAIILQAFRKLRMTISGLLLVLVPRHPPRFDKVASLCLAEGFSLGRRSLGDMTEGKDVFLVDTLGELRLFYAACDVAFVGGSLVEAGGHNMLEPAVAGVPVLFGPHIFNFLEAGNRLVEAGGAIQVSNAEAMTAQVLDLLQDSERAQRMGGNGKTFVDSGRGALERVEAALVNLLAY